jgi:accessory secretory protein Asp2
MRVLQIGRDDWSTLCRIPHDVEWIFAYCADPAAFDADLIGHLDVTILDSACSLDHLEAIEALITPYTLLVRDDLDKAGFDAGPEEFFARKAAVRVDMGDRQRLIDDLPRKYFAKQFGQKLEIRTAVVPPFHRSEVRFEGNAYLVTTINLQDWRQLVTWKENISHQSERPLELWPQFEVDPGCEIEFRVQLIRSGTADVIAFQGSFSQGEPSEPVIINSPTSGYLACSVFARGSGQVKVGPIHYRHSRLGAGQFLPGGRRIVDAVRDELFYYFHPGNLQPPLNIYFAGYRPAEGFEGYFMMTGLRHPFLLITDPRLEGGRFYLGSLELESKLAEVIREHIEELGFRERDVIFSGLSMGSFGALYYGSQFDAHAIIAGKPIVDLGHVAKRARLERPQEFRTILDIVNFWNREGDTSADSFTQSLIARWSGNPGFGDTKILMSYMLQDDYDDKAYYTLLGSQTAKATTIIARGYQGRHNDDNASIVAWFSGQYRRVIDELQEARGE